VWNLATKIHIIGRKQEFTNHRPSSKTCLLLMMCRMVVLSVSVYKMAATFTSDSVMRVRRACVTCEIRVPEWVTACVCACLLDLHLICTEPGSCVINVPLLFPIPSVPSVLQPSDDKLVNVLAPNGHRIVVEYISAPDHSLTKYWYLSLIRTQLKLLISVCLGANYLPPSESLVVGWKGSRYGKTIFTI